MAMSDKAQEVDPSGKEGIWSKNIEFERVCFPARWDGGSCSHLR